MQRKRLPKYAIAVCGFLSAIFIFYSIGVTSSNFKPLMSNDGVNLCYDGHKIAAGWGGPLGLAGPCPGWDQGKAAAVVAYEHPSLLKPALFLLIISFVLQFVEVGTGKNESKQPSGTEPPKEKPVSVDPHHAAFEFQLKEATELRAFAYSLVTGAHHGKFERKDYIGMSMFYRCLQTHKAVEIVVKQSLVDDGLVLVRSLVEHAVNAVYMLMIADAATADAFADYGDCLVYEQFASLKAADPDLMRSQVSAEDEDKMRKRYDAVLPKFEKKRGDKWCVDDALYKRASRLDHTLRQPEVNTEWRLLVNAVWRHASTYTHGTARALAGIMTQDGEVTTLERKVSYKEAQDVLQSANTAVYLSLLPVAGRLGLDLAPIHKRFEAWVAGMSAAKSK
jgi:Family of unknown function (DUF5677)